MTKIVQYEANFQYYVQTQSLRLWVKISNWQINRVLIRVSENVYIEFKQKMYESIELDNQIYEWVKPTFWMLTPIIGVARLKPTIFIFQQQKTNSGPNVVLIVNKSTLHRNSIYSGLQIKYYTRVLFLNENKTRLLFACHLLPSTWSIHFNPNILRFETLKMRSVSLKPLK